MHTSSSPTSKAPASYHSTASVSPPFSRVRVAAAANGPGSHVPDRGSNAFHSCTALPVHRAPPEMGARILSALDAAMAAHAEEQPATTWDNEGSAPEDVPAGTSRHDTPPPIPPPIPMLGNPSLRVESRARRQFRVTSHVGRSFADHHARCAAQMHSRGPPGDCSKPEMRLLSRRDRGCRFPGCTATQRLHGHHVKHWANGGETSLDNLVLLCPTHHRLVHEGGFDVQRLMTVHSGSPTRTDWPSDPHRGKRPRHRTRSSSRTRPSGSPSTARQQPRTGTGNASTTTMR